jgi:hypothetical protein
MEQKNGGRNAHSGRGTSQDSMRTPEKNSQESPYATEVTRKKPKTHPPLAVLTKTTVDAAEQDLLKAMAELFPGVAISLLAVMADYAGLVSGSQAVQAVTKHNCITKDSDIDLYIPGIKEAVEATMHVLSFTGVAWDNILSDCLDDIERYGMALLSHRTIYEITVKVLGEENLGSHELRKCLNDKLSHHTSLSSDIREDFVRDFTSTYLVICRRRKKEPFEEDEPDRKIWVYRFQKCKSCSIGDKVIEAIKDLVDVLDNRCSLDSDDEDEDFDEEKFKLVRREIESFRKKMDYHDQVVREYLQCQILKLRRFTSRAHIVKLMDDCFGVRETVHPRVQSFDPNYGPEMRILRGKLPGDRRIQLMIVDPRQGGLVRSVLLRFYSTHVMAFISGAVAGHLYFSTAEAKTGLLLDFHQDKRQKDAKNGVKKWKARDWVFRELHKNVQRRRHAADSDARVFSLDKLYIGEREKLGRGNEPLPKWWRAYFEERTKAVEFYSWVELDGKVAQVTQERLRCASITCPALTEWVHEELDGHEHVVSRERWQSRDELRIRADVFLGGVAIHEQEPDDFARWYDHLL